MDYGREAKRRVFSKDEAYDLAGELGVHLSEHGGTGIGVIGALAGAGLRLSGDDGRFKGKFRIAGEADGTARVADIKTYDVDEVRTPGGEALTDDERVGVGEECKLVLLGGRAVLLVTPAPERLGGPLGGRRAAGAEGLLSHGRSRADGGRGPLRGVGATRTGTWRTPRCSRPLARRSAPTTRTRTRSAEP